MGLLTGQQWCRTMGLGPELWGWSQCVRHPQHRFQYRLPDLSITFSYVSIRLRHQLVRAGRFWRRFSVQRSHRQKAIDEDRAGAPGDDFPDGRSRWGRVAITRFAHPDAIPAPVTRVRRRDHAPWACRLRVGVPAKWPRADVPGSRHWTPSADRPRADHIFDASAPLPASSARPGARRPVVRRRDRRRADGDARRAT